MQHHPSVTRAATLIQRHISACGLAALGVMLACASASSRAEDAELRRGCSEAVASASADRAPWHTRQRAIVLLQSCPEGPAALTSLLMSPPTDSATRTLLFGVSGSLRDRRVLTALMGVANNAARPGLDRVAAVAALVTHYDPMLSARAVPGRVAGAPLRGDLYRMSHDITTTGSQPLPADVKAQVRALLDQLATMDGDAVVRAFAASLRTQLPRL
jgi:hypothetical protein